MIEPWQLEFGMFCARHAYAVLALASWALFFSPKLTWRLWRQNRYLGEALERSGRVSSSRESALAERITDRLLSRFFKAPKPTLESLANDTQTPWKVEPSTGSFPKRG